MKQYRLMEHKTLFFDGLVQASRKLELDYEGQLSARPSLRLRFGLPPRFFSKAIFRDVFDQYGMVITRESNATAGDAC
jgi:hypothetical protein